MVDIFFNFLFLIFSIYVLLKIIFYALYEIKTQENKSGGIAIIVFSIIILTFATLFIFIKGFWSY